MSFWLFPSYPNYIFIPTSSFTLITQPEATVEASPIAQQAKTKIKLNISRQDLIKAGYNHKRNSWTQREDKKLLQLAKSQNLNWNQIGKKMNEKNSKMCYSRYRRLSFETKKRWTSKQQSIILDTIQQQGLNWKLMAKLVPARTAKQIQQHYNFCLKPGINKSEWTLEQDLELVRLLEEYSTNWKEEVRIKLRIDILDDYLKISAQKQKQTIQTKISQQQV